MRARLIAVLVALLGVAGFVQWSGLTGIRTPAERAAIAIMREPLPELGERNAFPALWLSPFDIPEALFETQVAEDVARWRALLDVDPIERRRLRVRFASSAAGRYEALPIVYGWPMLCFSWEPDCLERVRADPEATRRALGKVRAYLGRLDRLAQYDHQTNPFQRYGATGSPQFATLFAALLSDAALRQVEGDTGASDRLCAVAAQLRKLRLRSDDLGFSTSVQSLLTGAGRLYADARAEGAADAPLPESCARAFAPLAEAEFELCPAWRRLYQAEHETPDTTVLEDPGGPSPTERIGWATYDYRADDPHWARLLAASYCSSDRAARAQARARLSYDTKLLGCNAGERLFRPAICALREIGVSRFDDYHDLLLDLDARLTLMALAETLARLPAPEREAAFARRQRLPIEQTHPFAFGQGELTTPLLISRFEQGARVPLPGSRARDAQVDGGRR